MRQVDTICAGINGEIGAMNKYIISEKTGGLGLITLNSEKTLNALSTPMIAELNEILETWITDPGVACLMLQGAGEKAFCAGGDVRRLREAVVNRTGLDGPRVPPECTEFFTEEYKLDYAIHKYPKPIVTWGDGIVMGGGIGLVAGASHRVVTEKSKFAMPEITIGLYPDVGGTWFLNKMPPGFGLYVGLTGARLNAADCLFLNLADSFIPSSRKAELTSSLQKQSWSHDATANRKTVSTILARLSAGHDAGLSQSRVHESFIATLDQVDSVESFRELLEDYPEKDEWINTGIKTFNAGSPSSARVIFRQLRSGARLSLEEVFQSELNLSSQCVIHPDFIEGVRALLVDKDLKPEWTPARLEDVTDAIVDSYFYPLNFSQKKEGCFER